MQRLWKIRRKADGLFCACVDGLPFDQSGRSWYDLHALWGWVDLMHNFGYGDRLSDCEVVEFEIREVNKVDIQ